MIRTKRLIVFRQKGTTGKSAPGVAESVGKWSAISLPTIGLLFTAYTIYDTQYWKKAEFLSQHIEKFLDSPPSKITLEILDYDQRPVHLYSDSATVKVTEDEVAYALSVDTVRNDFEPKELKIRAVFDAYFDGLSAFNRYYKADLLSIGDLKPFLTYQIKLMADSSIRPGHPTLSSLRRAMWIYIDYYKLTDVKELLKQFDYDVSVTGPEGMVQCRTKNGAYPL